MRTVCSGSFVEGATTQDGDNEACPDFATCADIARFYGISIDSPEARLSKSGARQVDPYLRSLLLSNPARICGEWLRPSPLDSEGGDRVQG